MSRFFLELYTTFSCGFFREAIGGSAICTPILVSFVLFKYPLSTRRPWGIVKFC